MDAEKEELILSADQAHAYLIEVSTKGGHPGAVHKLVEKYRVDLSAPDEATGKTALRLAVENGCTDTVRALLSAGSPLVRRQHKGYLRDREPTAVEIAMRGKCRRMSNVFVAHALNGIAKGDVVGLQSLIDAGMDPNTKDGSKEQNTLLHWASTFGNADIVKLLVSRGANSAILNAAGKSPLDEAKKIDSEECAKILRASRSETSKHHFRGNSEDKCENRDDAWRIDKTSAVVVVENGSTKNGADTTSSRIDEKPATASPKLPDTMTWSCRKIEIEPGDDMVVPIQIPLGGTLMWTFRTLGGDIAFGIEGAPLKGTTFDDDEDIDEDDVEDVLDVVRTGQPSGVEVSGSATFGGPCRLAVIFDNSFSWWNSKILSYEIRLDASRPARSVSRSQRSRRVSRTVAATPEDRHLAKTNRCKENMAMSRLALRGAVEASQRTDRERHRIVDMIRDLEQQLSEAKTELSRKDAAVAAAAECVARYEGRLWSLLLRNIPKKRARNILVGLLSKRDMASWRCTCKSSQTFWD
eukprot:g845.t1